jgi:hypothetical protein
MEKRRQQRKQANRSKSVPNSPGGRGEVEDESQSKPDGPGDRLAILAAR